MITHGNLLYSLFQIITRTQISALIFPVSGVLTLQISFFTSYSYLQPPTNIPVCLAFLPMHHTYGLHVYCFQSLLAPSTIAIMPKWNINAALKAIPKYIHRFLTFIRSLHRHLFLFSDIVLPIFPLSHPLSTSYSITREYLRLT